MKPELVYKDSNVKSRLTKKKRDMMQITKVRSEIGTIITDSMAILKQIKGYYE
jgi:isochorismate hydrolase